MDHDRLYELSMRAIGCALEGDAEGATDAMMTIGRTGDWADVYASCCAYAEIGKAALVKFYGGNAPDLSRGDMWAMQKIATAAPVDPYEQFAVRFIITYANDDRDGAMALFSAALKSSSEDYVSSVAQLLATAVSLANSATRHARS